MISNGSKREEKKKLILLGLMRQLTAVRCTDAYQHQQMQNSYLLRCLMKPAGQCWANAQIEQTWDVVVIRSWTIIRDAR